MKYKLFTSVLFALCCTMSVQAQSLKDLFMKMPLELCPTLSEYNRLEIVDNQKNGKVMQTRNLMLTVSEMKILEDEFLYLVLNKNAEKTMKLLSCSDGTNVIAVVNTVFFDDTPDCTIEFYDTNWNKLDGTKYFDEPVSKQFRILALKSTDNTLSVTTANPIDMNVNGTVGNPKIKTEKKVLTWNGSKFI